MQIDKSMSSILSQPVSIMDAAANESPIEIEIVEDDGEMDIGAEVDLLMGLMEPPAFDANLAEHIDDQELAIITSDLMEGYNDDLQSRTEWEDTYKEGLELLGLGIDDRSEPWEGAFGAYHPLLAEAVVKFQSETIMETFPASGPVKTNIIGAKNQAREEAAVRVKDDMNYQLTTNMVEYRSEHERMLWNLAIAGSAFKKTLYDPTLERALSQFIPAEDFIISYGATDLRSAQRYTHRMKRTKNDIRKLQVSGFYVDRELDDPVSTPTAIESSKNDLTGLDAVNDDRYALLEMHCELDIPGFEDTDADGEPTGIALPYVVTIDEQSEEVMAVYRNWREEDPTKTKRVYFTHYTYIPGFGFYGFGLIHLIGGFAKGATSIMRQLVDAGTLANLSGGFRTRGLRIKGGDTPIAPGEFRDVDVPTGTLRDNLMPLPYKEPSMVLYKMLDGIVAEGRRFASVSDANVADMQPNAPVGSTLAILERTLKTMSAIQARIHAAMRVEFNILKEIFRDTAPPAYEYDAYGDVGQQARAEDYDLIEVIPVSDPNAATTSQRIIQYQAAHQMSLTAPQIYDLPLLHRQMIEVLGIRNAQDIVPDKTKIAASDPVSENMAILVGTPVKVYQYQDHEAHIATHMAFGQDPKLQEAMKMQGPEAKKKMAAGMAHINEHMAFEYRKKIEEQLGVPMPGKGDSLPQEAEVDLSRMVAQAADKLLKKHQQEAQAKKDQKMNEDPLIQMQKEELRIKGDDLKRKTNKDFLDYKSEMARVKLDAARMESNSSDKAAAIGAKIAMDVQKTEADLSKAGFLAGVDFRKEKQEKDK